MNTSAIIESRKKSISEEPLTIRAEDDKSFDNIVDFKKFITKHKDGAAGKKILTIEFFATEEIELQKIYFYVGDADEIIDRVQKTIYDIVNYPIHVFFAITRKENVKELAKRKRFIQQCKESHTKSLLNARFNKYLTDIEREIVYAILDTREHVPTGLELKKIRQEKAKLQKSR